MAIDLFCYTTLSADDANNILKPLSVEHQELFSQKFLISDPREASDVHKEIAAENELDAKSIFLIRVNDKSEAHRASEIANMLRKVFSEKNILVLWENEKPI